MDTSDLLSIIALVVSLLTFVINLAFNRYYYGPSCKISAYSVQNGAGVQIRLENVGNRIMRVKTVDFSVNGNEYVVDTWKILQGINFTGKAVARPNREVIIPNSAQNLLTLTFDDQDNLLKAWELISKLSVRVRYNGLLKRCSTKRTLKNDYEAFIDALTDGEGNMRALKVFKKLDK